MQSICSPFKLSHSGLLTPKKRDYHYRGLRNSVRRDGANEKDVQCNKQSMGGRARTSQNQGKTEEDMATEGEVGEA